MKENSVKRRCKRSVGSVNMGFEHMGTDSSPALGTDYKRNADAVLDLKKRSKNKLASAKASIELNGMSGISTFKKSSRLVIPANTSKDNRWYIKYWPYSETKGKHVLKRYYKIPLISPEQSRKEYALEMCRVIDRQLVEGAVIDSVTIDYKDTLSLLEAINRYKKTTSSMRQKSVYGVIGALEKFMNYLTLNGFEHLDLRYFTHREAESYLNYLKSQGLGNRSINNYIGYVKTFFNHYVRLDVLEKNPFYKIKKLRQGLGKNIAYRPDQVKELMEYMRAHPDIQLLCRWMYYTLMRTNEISRLQIKHIGMYVSNQIYLPAEISKNGVERHIRIPDALMQLIETNDILNYPKEYYVFSLVKMEGKNRKLFKPSPIKIDVRRFGERYRTYVLDKLVYGTSYTLYSWRHTGVVNAKMQGISDADIMQQTGHLDYGSFKVYLKSLGLMATGKYATMIEAI